MRILLVDDEILAREAIAAFLEDELHYEVTQCNTAQEAINLFIEESFPLVLTDVRMPGMSGLELLRNLRELPQGRLAGIILFTGYADVQTAVQAIRHGADDLLKKPIDLEELASVAARVADKYRFLTDFDGLQSTNEETDANDPGGVEPSNGEASWHGTYAEIPEIGKVGIFSDVFKAVVTMAFRLHDDRSIPVLIEGETGTGKEIIARLVHHGNGEIDAPFVSINCSAISPGLFESELFGYEGGAFTGAKKTGLIGKLELAKGGTLFLDEIGDLPFEMQPKLLRALQEKEIYQVGGLKKIPLDVRIIAATNRNLKKLVKDGLFREDLYHRLNMGWIHLPPLRRQKESIAPLAQLFLMQYSEQKNKRFRFIHQEALDIMETFSWPGNTRELKNTIERVVLLYNDIEVKPQHLSFLSRPDEFTQDLNAQVLRLGSLILPPDHLDINQLNAEVVRKALAIFEGNKSQTARYLGVTRSALRSLLKKTN